MKLFHLVDSREYVETNCFQHQLLADLRQQFEHVLIPLDQATALPTNEIVLSTIKIRNVYKHIDRLSALFANRNKIYFYDQDPWEAFIDKATYPGGYSTVVSRIPQAEFIVTSGWWRNFVADKGFKTHFCRMWMLPKYCSYGKPFKDRERGIVFRGQLHPFRRKGIEDLAVHGVNVKTVGSTPSYPDWLNWLRSQTSFFHDEADGWLIGGKLVSKQCAMPKEIEIASQGCFVFRDSQSMEEFHNYDLDSIPCVIPYTSYEDLARRVQEINSLDPSEADALIKRSVDVIKNVGGWVDMQRIVRDEHLTQPSV